MSYSIEPIRIDSFILDEIIFDEGFDVTIFCSKVEGELFSQEEITIGCDFKSLVVFLTNSGSNGQLVFDIITERISSYNESPCSISISNFIPSKLKIQNLTISVYKPKIIDEAGTSKDGEDMDVYLVDKIESI